MGKGEFQPAPGTVLLQVTVTPGAATAPSSHQVTGDKSLSEKLCSCSGHEDPAQDMRLLLLLPPEPTAAQHPFSSQSWHRDM